MDTELKVIKNDMPTELKGVNFSSDNQTGDEFKPPKPLKLSPQCLYIVGGVGSGKTSLWMNLLHKKGSKIRGKNKHHSRFLYKCFDKVYMMSASLGTMDRKKIKIPEHQVYDSYNAETLQQIIDEEKEDEENNRVLILLDDVIKDVNNSKDRDSETTLCKAILNRRHCTINEDGEKGGGLHIMITSQKYNFLPYSVRCNISQLVLFRTNNAKEKRNIYEEYGQDLSWSGFNSILDYCWAEPHSFLFLDINEPTERQYYKRFDLIVIPKSYLS